MRRGAAIREYARAQASDGPGAESAVRAQDSRSARAEVAGNARLVHEYMDYLRVERGSAPSDVRGLCTRPGAVRRAVGGARRTTGDWGERATSAEFMAHLRGNHVDARSHRPQAELPARILSLAAARQAHRRTTPR